MNTQRPRRFITPLKKRIARPAAGPQTAPNSPAASAAQLRALFANMLEGFALCRMLFDENNQPQDFIYVEVNGVYEKLSGMKDVVGKRVSELLPGLRDAYPQMFAAFGRVALGGQPEQFEIYLDPLKSWFVVSVYSLEQPYFAAVFDNVTLEKQAQSALAHERNLLRTVVDNLPDQIYLKDTQYRFLLANPAVWKEHHLQSEADLLGKNDFDLYAREEAELYRTQERAILKSGQAMLDREASWGAPDPNERHWIQTTKIPLRNEQGEVTGLVGLIRDVTLRRRAEEGLKQSEAFLQHTLDALSAHIAILDENGLILAVNQAWRKFGFENGLELANSGVNSNYLDITEKARGASAEEALFVAQTIQKLVKGEIAEAQVEYPCHSPQQKRWFVLHLTAFEDNGRRRVVAAHENITQRKQTELAQQESDSRLRQVWETVVEAMAISDENGIVIDVNPAYLNLYGFTREEVVGHSFSIVFSEEFRSVAEAQYKEIFASRSLPASFEAVVKRKDGSERTVESRATLLTLNGERTALLSTILDITERKQQQRELEAIAAISLALREADTRPAILSAILDQLTSLLNASAAAIDIAEPATGEILTELGNGLWQHLKGQRYPREGRTGTILKTGQPYLSADIRHDDLMRPSAMAEEVQAAAGLPLLTNHQIIGVVWVGRKEPFSPGEVRVMAAMADIAASALHRVSLHEQTQYHVRTLAALRGIDQAIMSSLDQKLTLTILLAQVCKLLEVDAADVLNYIQEQQSLTYIAGAGFRSSLSKKPIIHLSDDFAGRVVRERRYLHIATLTKITSGTMADRIQNEEFTDYYAVPLIAKGKVLGVLELFHRQSGFRSESWRELLDSLAAQAAIAIDNNQMFAELQRSNMELELAYDATIEGWSRALDLRYQEADGHSQRVTEMTLGLARALGVSVEDQVHIRRGALLHDIGKMGVPDEILQKSEPLTGAEWETMKKHPSLAYELLSPIRYLQPALEIPYAHHEKWDGSGYPLGLKGEQIPLAARLFAVVDTWDALSSGRPYRPAWPPDKIKEHIQSLAGKHLDPKVVQVFLASI